MFDDLLTKKFAELNRTPTGRFFSSLSSRVRCVTALAGLNILGTAMLGFLMTYPLYLAGGFWAALPTTIVTVLLTALLSISIFNHWLGEPLPGSTTRQLLVFAILFSMPCGMLSLPLLHNMSSTDSDYQKRILGHVYCGVVSNNEQR